MAKINYDDNISITSILDKLPNENVANNLREEYDSLTVLIGNMLKSLKDNPTTAVKTRTETLKMYTAMRDACLNNILRYLATNSGSQAVVQSIMHDYQVKLQGHYSNTAIGIAAIGKEASLTEAQQAQLSKLLIDFGDVSTKLLSLTVSKLWAELG